MTTWTDTALSQLQDCFSQTDWDLFSSHGVREHTDTVLMYIKHCVESVTVKRHIKSHSNRKPWISAEVKRLLKKRDSAFRSGDKQQYSLARAELKRGIRKAKEEYKRRVEGYLTDKDTHRMWQEIKHITNYKGSSNNTDNTDASLAEELNSFFARFEVKRTATATALPPPPPSTYIPPPIMQEHEVRRVLKSVNPREAAGPDMKPSKVYHTYAYQFVGVFTVIFSTSLSQNIIPPCLKSAISVPVPKKTAPAGELNTLCFERLVSQLIKKYLPPSLNPNRYAYRPNRSTENHVSMATHVALSHLEQQDSYVWMLFIDYSSAFNTVLSDFLVTKLLHLGLPSSICMWITDFLTNRTQTVRLGKHLSSYITLSTGAPQH